MNFNFPINPVSFGVVSTAILRAAHKANLTPSIFPIGPVDLAAQKVSPEFGGWLQKNINECLNTYDRKATTIKLWHINGAIDSVGSNPRLLTFHETDSITPYEKNILASQDKVYVTANSTKAVFNEAGLNNVEYVELGFDHDNFYPINKTFGDGVITFGLFGKLEFRKAHEKILKAWVKKYGNNPRYRLHAAIFNPFFDGDPNKCRQIFNQKLSEILDNKRYQNVTFLDSVKTNAEYNHIINNIDIVIGCSRAEGRDLPVFHAVGLGKHCVALNAHAYKDYLTPENATLIDPTGMVPASDGMFFNPGQPFNQGNFYDFDEDDFLSACQKVELCYTSNPKNVNGMQLQKLSYTDTLNQIIK